MKIKTIPDNVPSFSHVAGLQAPAINVHIKSHFVKYNFEIAKIPRAFKLISNKECISLRVL